MAKITEAAEAPLLPPTSVDFNALHDALKAGKTADEAKAAAIIADPAPKAPETPAPSPDVA